MYGGAELKVSGDAKIKALKLDPRDESGLAPAKVTLSGGEYGEISISAAVTDENLQEEEGGFAFLDMLAEGYAFADTDDSEILNGYQQNGQESEQCKGAFC